MMKTVIRTTTWFLMSLLLLGLTSFAKAAEKDVTPLQELDLPTTARMALAGNPTLAAARARVAQARQQLQQARSTYWPRVDAVGSAVRTWPGDAAQEASLATARLFDPAATVDDEEDRFSAALTADWIVFNGFERKFANAAARWGVTQSQSAWQDVARLLLAAVTDAFYAAQLAREEVAIARADEDFNRRQLREAEARERIGTGSLSDVLNFKVRVNSALADRITAERIYATTLYSLAALLGIEEARFAPGLEIAPLTPEQDADMQVPADQTLIAYAHKHRPDLKQNTSLLMQTEARVEAARAGFYPRLNLTAALEGDRRDDADFQDDDFGHWVGVNLTYNLFAGGLTRAQVDEAKALQMEAESNLADNRLAVNAQVRRALAGLVSAQKQLTLQRANAKLVRRNRDLVEKEYAAGQGSLVRLNEAQRDLITARSRLALARVSLRSAWSRLETATGRILATFDVPAEKELR